ncbi:MAG: hypothetical protein HFE04_00075 [Bacilli bacterium]|nr:hypothetical protein [Bacilli bacterium]
MSKNLTKEREIAVKIQTAQRVIEYIESLEFNIEKEKKILDEIIDEQEPNMGTSGRQYKTITNKKLKMINTLLESLQKYEEYYKIINAYQLLKKAVNLNQEITLPKEYYEIYNGELQKLSKEELKDKISELIKENEGYKQHLKTRSLL